MTLLLIILIILLLTGGFTHHQGYVGPRNLTTVLVILLLAYILFKGNIF